METNLSKEASHTLEEITGLVSVFDHRSQAETVMRSLDEAGSDTSKFLIIGGGPPEETLGGLSVFASTLFSLGISENLIALFADEVGAGKYLLVIHGTQKELSQARRIAKASGANRHSPFIPRKIPPGATSVYD